jgi:hypothetical protein
VRYEDLLGDYDAEVQRLVRFLGLDEQSQAIRAVIDRFRPEQARADQKGIHFNKGKTGRFRQKLAPEEQAVLSEKFGDYLIKMGYLI